MRTLVGGDRQVTTYREGDDRMDSVVAAAEVVYSELHRIARAVWGGHDRGNTLQPTALINEAYIKLVDSGQSTFQNRAHFFAVASMAMRQILVNHAQSNLTAKRGGNGVKISINDVEPMVHQQADEVMALNDALKELEALDPRKSRVVELRYFGGLSIEETAEALNVSIVTVNRDWRLARAWLLREINGTAS